MVDGMSLTVLVGCLMTTYREKLESLAVLEQKTFQREANLDNYTRCVVMTSL